MILYVFTIIVFAFLNRARGSQLYGFVNSTEVGRLISVSVMAFILSLFYMPDIKMMAIVFLAEFAALMLWCSPLWDKYWGEEIGDSLTHSRLYGLMQMTLRMSLIIPAIAIMAYPEAYNLIFALGFPILAIPYYIFGYLTPGANVIRNSELAVGAMLGFLMVAAHG